MIVSAGIRPQTLDDLLRPELSARLDRLDVVSRRVLAGTMQGERRSKRRGQSVEFADHRNYVAGDDLRRIDWNVFARLDKFFIRIFQEEEDLAVHILLDASASMDAGGVPDRERHKLLYASRLAMALAYVALVKNNRVALGVFGHHRFQLLPPARGRRHVQRLGSFLLDALNPQSAPPSGSLAATNNSDPDAPPLEASTPGDFTAAMRTIARARTGRGVIVLLSDFLIPTGYEPGLRWLAGASASGPAAFDVHCLQILAPDELDPAAARASDNRPGPIVGDLRLVDAETGRAAEVTITAELLQSYRKALTRYIDDLHRFCTSRGMSHLLIPTSTPPESLLLDTLRRIHLLG